MNKKRKLCKGVSAVKGHRRIYCLIVALLMVVCLSLEAAAVSPISDSEAKTTTVEEGLSLTTVTATAAAGPQSLYVLEADPQVFSLAIGGKVSGKTLVEDMEPIAAPEGAPIVAAINGDHFSFATGVPMGMSISGGRLVTSPIEPYNADEYYFHALGLTDDGEVLVGENPTLYMQCTVGDETITIDRINRTREMWEGGQVCVFTTDYGASTGTNATGVEFVIDIGQAALKAGETVIGTVTAIDEDGDAPIEEGTVVLSVNVLQYAQVESIAVGDEVELYTAFEEEAWNDVTFAVGGNMTIVDDGEPILFDYTLDVFKAAQPRSALGVREDGTLVMVAVDGRSDVSCGLTANEVAQYMAEDLDCAYAILLDGGGSTAMAVRQEDGALQTVNVPSEERPVGNGVLLLKTGQADSFPYWLLGVALLAAVIALVIVVVMLITVTKKNGKNA